LAQAACSAASPLRRTGTAQIDRVKRIGRSVLGAGGVSTVNDFELALDNLEAVLAAAEMTLANVVRLNAYTTCLHQTCEKGPAPTPAGLTR
jgi:enamine deaminase RidA (YjgF/YER057c/UK114 family)